MLKTLHSRHNEIFLSMLRSQREAQRLRQSDLAKRLGRGQGMVSKVECGERRLDVIELRAWLGAMGVDFLSFMGELESRLRPHVVPDADLRAGKRSRQPPRPSRTPTHCRS